MIIPFHSHQAAEQLNSGFKLFFSFDMRYALAAIFRKSLRVFLLPHSSFFQLLPMQDR